MYRLATEAEWEYACRAGTTSPWSFGAGRAELDKHAWFKATAAKTTQPVKQQRRYRQQDRSRSPATST